MTTPPLFLPGKSRGQKSLASYSPQGCNYIYYIRINIPICKYSLGFPGDSVSKEFACNVGDLG